MPLPSASTAAPLPPHLSSMHKVPLHASNVSNYDAHVPLQPLHSATLFPLHSFCIEKEKISVLKKRKERKGKKDYRKKEKKRKEINKEKRKIKLIIGEAKASLSTFRLSDETTTPGGR